MASYPSCDVSLIAEDWILLICDASAFLAAVDRPCSTFVFSCQDPADLQGCPTDALILSRRYLEFHKEKQE
jgi:hypothetical protein